MTEQGRETINTAMRRLAAFCIDRDLRMSAGLDFFEKAWLSERLARTGNNRCAVADIEGIHRNTVTRHLDALGVARGKRGGKGARKRRKEQT